MILARHHMVGGLYRIVSVGLGSLAKADATKVGQLTEMLIVK